MRAAKRKMVTPTKMTRSVEAVLVTAVVAVLTAGAKVGIGRGVGVVGGGIMHFSPEAS